jgi:two-component system, NtrC family, response regulator HydG
MPEEKVQVLIVDDESAHADAVSDSLERAGFECTIAADGEEALRRIESEQFDVVLTDLMMGRTDGLEVLRKAKQELPEAEVIVVTGHGTIKTAVTAMQQGAYTYLTKPLDINELRTVVGKATERHRLRQSNIELRQQLDEKFGFEGVVGNSLAMHKVIARLRLVAPTPATVLILGENGTGKELVARSLHTNSPRKHKPFVALNCAALSESILESELFGHERGAFTGADRTRKGRFEFANGGTLFLDEVGDLPMSTQIKLLRVIESREIMRVGSNDPLPVNVRLISATNRDIAKMVADGDFRQDLYYRLKVVTIHLPPLRERPEDIPLLCEHFVKEFAQTHGKPTPTVSTPVMRMLRHYPWPGNVRELRNTLESMVVIDQDQRLDIDDLPDELQGREDVATPFSAQDSLVGKPLKDVEAYYIEQALKQTEGNREAAATMLDIGERTLYRKIKDYNIPTGKSERRKRRGNGIGDEMDISDGT